MNYENAVSNIRKELKHYIQSNNIKSLILGVSGGIDSALCAALAKPVCDELNIPLIGVSMPIITNKIDEITRASNVGKSFCSLSYQEDLSDFFNKLSIINPSHIVDDNIKDWSIRNGNIKARIRMIYLYNFASIYKGIVLSTDNYTEYLLGFWTICGDIGDYGMIQNLWKTEVYEMSDWLIKNELKDNQLKCDALQSCINCMATDGLGVTNLGDLGQILPDWKGNSRVGYQIVDQILKNYLEDNTFFIDHPVIKRHLASQFKRNWPITIKRDQIFK